MRLRFLLLVVLFSLLLSSCDSDRGAELECFDGAFACEYSYFEEGLTIRARLKASARGEDGKKEVELCFLEPSALSGVTCEKLSGGYRATLSGMTLVGESASVLFFSAEPFLCDGKAVFCGMSDEGGERLERFEIVDGNAKVSVYVDGKTECPRLIRAELNGRSVELHIISFEAFGG